MVQILMIVGYLALTTCIAFYFRKKAQSDTNNFYTAKSSMSAIVVATLLFSEMIAGSGTIGNATNAYNGGFSNSVWAIWGMALGCVFVVLTVANFYKAMSMKYGCVTIPETFAVLFDERARTLMVFIVALVYMIMYSTQPVAAATILGPLLNIEASFMTWIITACFIVVAIFGGMGGAAKLGVMHSTIMYIGVGIVAIASVDRVGGLSELMGSLPEGYFDVIGDDPFNVFANALGTAVSFLAASTVTTTLFGAKSLNTAKRGILVSAVLVVPFALLPSLIGMSAHVLLPETNPTGALFYMATELGILYSGIICMAIVAAIWSTAPALLIIISATLTKDFYIKLARPNASEKQQLRFSYFVISMVAIVGTAIGMNASSILNSIMGAFQIRSIVGIVLLAAIIWPRVNANSAYWSMLIGGFMSAVWFFAGNPFGVAALWPGVASGLLVLIPLTLKTKEPISEGYKKYKVAKDEMELAQKQN